jgi:hypothetical protein
MCNIDIGAYVASTDIASVARVYRNETGPGKALHAAAALRRS